MAIALAVTLKYFVVEAYRIPTGSMQPTLMGNDESGIHDRILVDKLSYHFRDPERFEVIVFKYPLDRSKNFIKRLWGLPGEEVRIANGDVLVRAPGEEWRVPKRSPAVLDEMLKPLDTLGNWRLEATEGAWLLYGDTLEARAAGSARFPREMGSVMDHYSDGYPGTMASAFEHFGQGSGAHPVGDLRVEATVTCSQDARLIVFELWEGKRIYRFHLPGPAADPALQLGVRVQAAQEQKVQAEGRLAADTPTRVAVQNIDDQLVLELAGETVLSLDIEPATDQRSAVFLRTTSGGVRFDDVRVARDIYYTADTASVARWQVPADSYLVLGDNTQDSADAREWKLAGYALNAGAESPRELRGNLDGRQNPFLTRDADGGSTVFFRDEFGERHAFPPQTAERLRPLESSYVPRHMITGRALLVFWPFAPKHGVVRLQWVR